MVRPSRGGDPIIDTLVGIGMLCLLGILAYIVLSVMMGFFGIALPVPDWLWGFTTDPPHD